MQIINISADINIFNLNHTSRDRGGRCARAGIKKNLEKQLAIQIKPQIKKKLIGIYEVDAHWLVANRSRDLDNLMLKSIFDCMQKIDVLENDSLNHIQRITHTFSIVEKNKTGVIVTFKEMHQ